jgi:hypothetical protein
MPPQGHPSWVHWPMRAPPDLRRQRGSQGPLPEYSPVYKQPFINMVPRHLPTALSTNLEEPDGTHKFFMQERRHIFRLAAVTPD